MARSTIVDLIVNLIGNDASLLRATRTAMGSLEDLAATSAVAAKKTTTAADAAAAAAEAKAATIQRVQDKFKKFGRDSAIALLAIGGYSVEAAAKFQQQMMLIQTQAGASADDVKKLSGQVLAMASDVGQSPDNLAKGLYHIMSAGFSTTESIDILHAAAVNASMGMSDMEASAQGIIGVLAAGMPDIKNAADAAAFLNTTVGIGDMRFDQLNKSIATGVLSTFKVAGLGAKDYGAALATMTDNVVPANVAATRLRMAIALLAGPSNVAIKGLKAVGLGANDINKAFKDRKELEKYGINLSQLSADLRQPNGLLVALQDLQSHLKSSGLTATEQTAVINRAFGGGRTSAGIQQLLSEMPRLEDKYNKLGTSATRLKQQQAAWAAQQGTFKQQTHELGAALQVMAIKLGSVLLPPLTKFVNFLVTHKAAMVAFFAVIIIMMGLFTLAWIAMSASMLANPVFWVVLAIVAAIALLAIGIYELVKHWKTVWAWIKRIAADVWGWLKDAWKATWNVIKGVIAWIMKYIIDPIVAAWNWIVKALKIAWHAIQAVFKWAFDNIFAPVMRWLNKWVIQPFKIMFQMVVFGFKFIWGFVSAILKDLFAVIDRVFIKPMIATFKTMWGVVKWVWHQIVAGFDIVLKGLKIIWGFIKKYVIDPLGKALDFVKKLWDKAWSGIKTAASNAWDGLKKIWGYIKQGYDTFITKPLNEMKKLWDKLWDGIKSTVTGIWNDHIKPIFDKIKGAIDTIVKGIKSIDPGKAGAGLWNGIKGLFGFAEGGRVPGPPGAPMLAVVHGGEYVLSNDMQRGVTPVVGLGSVFAGGPGVTGMMGHGPSVDRIVVQIDERTLFDILVKRAQRNKGRNTSTFLN